MPDKFFPVAVKHIDHWNFDERVAARLLAYGGTGGRYHDLCRQGRVVDVHVEFKQLVLRFTGYPFPGEVHAVPHVEQCVYVFHLHHVLPEVRYIPFCDESRFPWG